MRDDVQDMIQDLFDDGYMIDVQDDIDLSLLRIVHAMAAKLKQQERSLNILGNMPDRVRSMQDALVQYSEHMKANDRLNAQLDTKVGEWTGLDKRLKKLETSNYEHLKVHDLLSTWGQGIEETLKGSKQDIDTLYENSDRSDTVYALHDTSLQTLHATVKEQGERMDVLAERLRTQHERQDVHNGRILNIDVRLNKELEKLTEGQEDMDHVLQSHHQRLGELETERRIPAVPPATPAGPIPPVSCDAAQQNSKEWPPKPAFRDNMTKLERESIQRLRDIVDRDISEYGPKSGPKYWEPLPPFNKVMTANIADPPELSPNEAQKLREEIDQLKKETREAFQDSEDRFDSMNQRMRNYTGRLTLLTDGLDETLANEHDVQEALELARAARLTPKEESGIIAKVSHKTKRELKMLYSDIDARLMLLAKSIDELREGANVTPTKSLDKKYPYRPHSQIEQRTTGDNGAGLLTDKQRDKPKWNPAVPARPAPSDQDMDDELDTTG